MLDFVTIATRKKRIDKKDILIIYPKFKVNLRSKDLMVRGGDFYAIWDEETGLWSTDEQCVIDKIDKALKKKLKEFQEKGGDFDEIFVEWMWDGDSKAIDRWHKFVQKQMRDNFHMLDSEITFSNTEVDKESYASKRLPYPLKEGEIKNYETLISTLYDPDERRKLEWIIGAIISGDSKSIQKFGVLFGPPGSGKSTYLDIVELLFEGYTASFSAKSMGAFNNDFALDSFKDRPLIAIDSEAELSRIEDNTMLNSVVSHDRIEINPKYGKKYSARFECFLLMATNKPVKITDAKSGLLRRLIDISPSGRTISPQRKYLRIKKAITFELSGIAWHCLKVYEELGEDYYSDYIPRQMMALTNDFYDFLDHNFDDLVNKDFITEAEAWKRYKAYCEFAGCHQAPLRIVRQELKNYFSSFEERGYIDGKRVRSVYRGFKVEKFQDSEKKEDKEEEAGWLVFDGVKSIFDEQFKDWMAQYEVDYGRGAQPKKAWSKVTTTLKDIDTSRTHYVLPPKDVSLIMADFDIRDGDGNKDLKANIKAALEFPPTYAEVSKSGGGIHLYYFYDGDVDALSRILAPNIELKVFTGNAAIRRNVTKFNSLPIETLSSGLPKKGEKKKMVDWEGVKNEKMLRGMIAKCLAKGYHADTTSNVDYIEHLLNEAYEKGIKYNVTDMFDDIFAFAKNSSNQKERNIATVGRMKFKSDEEEEVTTNVVEDNKDIQKIVLDIEIYRPDPETDNPGLFLICYKYLGTELIPENVNALINPSPEEVERLFSYPQIGFNILEYDCHMEWAAAMGKDNEDLYKLSSDMINEHRNDVKFREAKKIVDCDVYEYCKASGEGMGLKKWEIKLQREGKMPEDVDHIEMAIPWDQPAPKNVWDDIIKYCKNDVLATETVYWETQNYLNARRVQVDIVHALQGDDVEAHLRDTANTLSKRIIFGRERKPQYAFNYRDLAEPIGSDRYEEYLEKFGHDYKFRVWNEKGLPEYRDYIPGEVLPDGWSILPFFPGYTFDRFAQKGKKSFFMDDYGGEGGRTFSKCGYYERVWDGDIASQYPHSIMAEVLFGNNYTSIFSQLVKARVAVKHKDFELAGSYLNGALKPYLTEDGYKDLAQALKIIINAIYGLTSASFENEFKDPRNIDNIVAKRGNLFMLVLKSQIEEMGYEVCHIKTDSIKIPEADQKIKDFVVKFGREYGYEFETEAEFDKFVLLNDAAYVGRQRDGSWSFKADQFKPKFLQKMLFTGEKVEFSDYCLTFSVQQGAIYLDLNEDLEDVTLAEKRFAYLDKKLKKEEIPKGMSSLDEVEKEMGELDAKIRAGHNLRFIGRVGQFVPVVSGVGGGYLYRVQNGKMFAIGKTSGYRWLEAESVKAYGWMDKVNLDYFRAVCDEAVDDIQRIGNVSFDYFLSPVMSDDFLNVPEGMDEEVEYERYKGGSSSQEG